LQNNREIKNAYLRRILDRQNLEVAEDEFNPNLTPRVELVYNRNQFGSTTTNRGDLNLGADLSVTIPTGASISARWTGARLTQNTTGTSSSNDQNSLDQNISVTFTQPLLRGFGVDVNRAPIEIARLQEQINILELQSTLISNITSTLQVYRNLLEAQEALQIQKNGLESARKQLEYTEALIEAGRLAGIERVQAQTTVANRQLSLLAAQNSLDQARLRLIRILDIDKSIQIVATEKPSTDNLELVSFTQEEAKEIALNNNIDYLQSLITIERANIELLLAQNEKNWNLDFNAGYQNNLNNTAENSNGFSASLSLSREFGDRNFENQVERSQIQLEIAQNNLQEQRDNLEIDVINALRDVEFSLQQLEQAKKARELSEQQLENEREKLRLGVPGSRLLDVLRFENDLVNAQNSELNAQIRYLNSLTSLYATLGITLERWEITVEPENSLEEED
jgi:outer membrane protein